MKESKLRNVCVLFMDTIPLNQLSLPDHHPVHLFIYLFIVSGGFLLALHSSILKFPLWKTDLIYCNS